MFDTDQNSWAELNMKLESFLSIKKPIHSFCNDLLVLDSGPGAFELNLKPGYYFNLPPFFFLSTAMFDTLNNLEFKSGI